MIKTQNKINQIMPEFDKDVFELMIDKVIIGEKEQNGKTNPRVIAFILKSGSEIKCKEEKNQQSLYEVSKNYLQPMCEPRGVHYCAISKEILMKIVFNLECENIMRSIK